MSLTSDCDLRPSGLLAVLSCLFCAIFCSTASAQTSNISARYQRFAFDSGALDNPANDPQVLFEIVVDAGPQAPWVRLAFDDVQLQRGSFVRMTSLLDADFQTLNAEQMNQWRRGSAFFNGNRVLVEMIGGARTRNNSISMRQVLIGLPSHSGSQQPSICGIDDDRAPTNHDAIARLLTGVLGDDNSLRGGCTGFIIATPPGPDKCHLSAGHCLVAGVGAFQMSTVVQFNVPGSNADCTMNHPPAAKQFAIKDNISDNGGKGDDWSVFTCFRNPDTNLSTYEEQDLAIALGVPAIGGQAAVTGHGVDGTDAATGGGNAACLCSAGDLTGQRNKILQTHAGPVVGCFLTILEYLIDTCGANSGSPVLDDRGMAMAIHTHGGCDGGGPNSGTKITHPGLVDAIAQCKSDIVTTIPTMSEWAMAAMTLLLAAAGSIILIRRRQRPRVAAPTL